MVLCLSKATSPPGSTPPAPTHSESGSRSEAADRDSTSLGMTAAAHAGFLSVWPDSVTVSLNGSGTATYIMLQETEGCLGHNLKLRKYLHF